MERRFGVLFDVDGTLVDSNDAHAAAWVEALAEGGYQVPLARVRALIGMGGDKLLPELTKLDADGARGRHIKERRKEIFRGTYLPHLRPFAGTRGLIAALRARRFKVGVATSAEKEELAALLHVAGAEELLGKATSSDDADRSKPDPDIIQAALQRLGLPAGRVTMVGDTPYDIEAASSAGVRCIALRCGGWSDKDLAGAAGIYADVGDLSAHLDEALPAR